MSQEFANNPKTGMTFEETASEWLAAKKPQVQPSTYVKYRNILQKHLLPALGPQPVCSIRRRDLARFALSLEQQEHFPSGRPLAPKTINDILSVARDIFSLFSSRGCAIMEKTDRNFLREETLYETLY